jgi:probable biosynthetic protein (TIGR04099 family)
MNMAVPHLQAIVPTSRSLMERSLEPYTLLGMPHLTPFGLSETWLMKELGHRHWLMLAIHLGMENADFRTPDGREAYASICASSLGQIDEGLAIAKPNDILEIRSSFSFLARNQHSSLHRLHIGDRRICDVELVSTFVARQTEADNHTLARVEKPSPLVRQLETSELAGEAPAMRKAAAARQNLSADGKRGIFETRFSPRPNEDFNGAGLLYFANFQGFVAQAISQSKLEPRRVKRLEIFFFGNIRSGESISVCLQAPLDNGTLLADVVREDGKIIAMARCFSTEPAS